MTAKKAEQHEEEKKQIASPEEVHDDTKHGFHLVRGMKDILPGEQRYWQWLLSTMAALSSSYGFERLDTPILEGTNLFVRSVGEGTDIVEKEMFSFVDQGGDHLSLRPEFTAAVARAYLDHGMVSLPQPVKLWTTGPLFRHERPQAGRLREHHQWDAEILGTKEPIAEAELLMLLASFFKTIGLATVVHMNSVGCSNCRGSYKQTLVNHWKAKKRMLCPDCQRRLLKNPLRIFDCKEEGCQPVKEDAPQMIDWLCDECKAHFMKVFEFLDEAGVEYWLEPHLVRGLDYYTRTVFEFWPKETKEGQAKHALCGGGRYDTLVEELGGRPTPAIGFGLGIERLILQCKMDNVVPPVPPRPLLFLAQLGEVAKRKLLVLFEQLRHAGFSVHANFSKDGLKQQLEYASRLGVRYTLILGQKEVLEGTIILRDMDGGVQEVLNYEKVIPELERRIGTSEPIVVVEPKESVMHSDGAEQSDAPHTTKSMRTNISDITDTSDTMDMLDEESLKKDVGEESVDAQPEGGEEDG